MMNCEDFVFSSKVNMTIGFSLATDCTNQSNTSAFYISDYFTGFDNLLVNFDTSSTSTAYLCVYDDTSGSPTYSRSTIRNGNTYQLDSSKYYRVSTRVATGFSNTTYLQKCHQLTPVQQIGQKLNSIDSNDLYSNLSLMTPFLIFLLIFSFSFLVLRRVIKSSSRGDSNI